MSTTAEVSAEVELLAAGAGMVPGSTSSAADGRVAAELVKRAGREFPAVLQLGERERLLVSAWLSSLRSARTRRSYFADVRAWLAWLAERGVDVLSAGRVHVDLWVGGDVLRWRRGV
jgi:integrase/recombinase XerD